MFFQDKIDGRDVPMKKGISLTPDQVSRAIAVNISTSDISITVLCQWTVLKNNVGRIDELLAAMRSSTF